MIKNKWALICAWFITFALSVFLILIIPDQYTSVIIAVLIFDCIAFISQLILWLQSSKGNQSAEGIFQNAPVFVVSCAYLAIECVFNVICAALPNALPFKTVLIVNVCILAVAWIVIAALYGTKNHIQRVGSRQKNNHVEL